MYAVIFSLDTFRVCLFFWLLPLFSSSLFSVLYSTSLLVIIYITITLKSVNPMEILFTWIRDLYSRTKKNKFTWAINVTEPKGPLFHVLPSSDKNFIDENRLLSLLWNVCTPRHHEEISLTKRSEETEGGRLLSTGNDFHQGINRNHKVLTSHPVITSLLHLYFCSLHLAFFNSF